MRYIIKRINEPKLEKRNKWNKLFVKWKREQGKERKERDRDRDGERNRENTNEPYGEKKVLQHRLERDYNDWFYIGTG